MKTIQMSSDINDKCLVCLKAGGNLNIFTTYNICEDKEELYVEVIRNCFNIQIPPDAGLITMCSECSLKLRKAYNFKHSVEQAVSRLCAAQVTDSSEDKEYSQVDYLDDDIFDQDYDIRALLNPETGQLSYTLQKIYNNQETIKVDQNYLIDLDNHDIKCEKDEKQNEKDTRLIPEAQLYKLNKVNESINAGHKTNLLHDDVNVKLGNVKTKESMADVKRKYGASTMLHPETGHISYVLENEDETSHNDLTGVDNKVVGKIELSKSDTSKVIKKIKIIRKGMKLVKDNLPESVKKNYMKNDVIKDVKAGMVKENLPEKSELIRYWDTIPELVNMLGDDEEIKNLEEVINKDVRAKMHVHAETVKENVCENVEEIHIMNDERTNYVETEAVTETVQKIMLIQKGVTEHVEDVMKQIEELNGIKAETLSCEQCQVEFASSKALLAHACTRGGGPGAAGRAPLQAHRRDHARGPFHCRYCNQEFGNKNTRNAHQWRVHSTQEPFKCPQCEERFRTYLQRLRHRQAAHGLKEQYPCHYCKKTFAYAAYRTKHIRIMHHQERPHKCPQCPLAFAKRGVLVSHLAAKHGVGEMKHQCTVCLRRFAVKSVLAAHIKTHNARFSCFQCEQRFKKSSELEYHLKTNECGEGINMSLDFVASLHLDELPDDYSFLDSCCLDLNEL